MNQEQVINECENLTNRSLFTPWMNRDKPHFFRVGIRYDEEIGSFISDIYYNGSSHPVDEGTAVITPEQAAAFVKRHNLLVK